MSEIFVKSYFITALELEKQIKKWNRSKKVNIIKGINPNWENLSTVFEITNYYE